MIAETQKDADAKMQQAVEFAREDMATIRTGRAHPAMFNKLQADYYGAPTPLQQLATFTSPDPRSLLITPFDRGAISGIEKAIRDSDLGVNPSNDGVVIRVMLPTLTEERRRDYVKLAKSKGEDARVSVRSIRRKAREDLEKLSKDGDVGEDEANRAQTELDSLTRQHTDEVDALLAGKEKELLEV